MTTSAPIHQTLDSATPPERHQVDCCVVGAGPAGLVLSLLLARKGVRVHLMEGRDDFDHDFRDDLAHPSALEILDSIGLADPLLKLAQARIPQLAIHAADREIILADFTRIETKFPYAALIPHAKLLQFLAGHAREYAGFALSMGANVSELIREEGRVKGAKAPGLEIRAKLTVACDGGFSRLRALAGLSLIESSPPVDVLWFALPREPGDLVDHGGGCWARPGRLLIRLDRGDQWRLGLMVPNGGSQRLREQGLPAFRNAVAAIAPEFTDRLEAITDWRAITTLSVESSRLKTWHRPGILFLGDAAHAMSLVGGVGVNYAIQDAVEAANVLVDPLRTGAVATAHLIEIQRRRELPTRLMQLVQAWIQARIIGEALDATRPPRLPWFFKIPGVPALVTRLIAFGPRRTRVE